MGRSNIKLKPVVEYSNVESHRSTFSTRMVSWQPAVPPAMAFSNPVNSKDDTWRWRTGVCVHVHL